MKKQDQVSALSQIRGMSKEAIKKRNEAFNALSPMEKRLAVAKEVLMMLRSGEFVAGDGYGYQVSTGGGETFLPEGELQDNLVGGITCIGCAKAGIYVAKAVLGNDVNIKDGGRPWDIANRESFGVFGETAANIIEDLYEECFDPDWMDDESTRSGISQEDLSGFWGDTKPRDRTIDPMGRMIDIFERIVENDGYVVIGDERY